MESIVKYACEELGGADISCVLVNGDPCLKGVEVAMLLGYEKPRDATYDHVPLKFKSKLSYLLRTVIVGETPTMTESELSGSWISEEGLHKLIFRSKVKAAEIFSDWVCGVIKSIRKTGSYNSQYFYNQAIATKNEVRELAVARGREDALHYEVVDHIKAKYPDAMIHAGLGEHLTTKHAGLDA